MKFVCFSGEVWISSTFYNDMTFHVNISSMVIGLSFKC